MFVRRQPRDGQAARGARRQHQAHEQGRGHVHAPGRSQLVSVHCQVSHRAGLRRDARPGRQGVLSDRRGLPERHRDREHAHRRRLRRQRDQVRRERRHSESAVGRLRTIQSDRGRDAPRTRRKHTYQIRPEDHRSKKKHYH